MAIQTPSFFNIHFSTYREFIKLFKFELFVFSLFFFFYNSIKFEFGLAVYASGGFSNLVFNAAVDLTIFGKRLYLALGFNLRDPVGSVRFGADKATDWYKDKMNKKGATSTAENYYDNPNPFADFEMSGTCYKHYNNNNNK